MLVFMFPVRSSSQTGFSLIELVAVMILLGVLAVTALPRFTGKSDFSLYSARDQITAGARLAQQRAMIDRHSDLCYRLVIASNVLALQYEDSLSVIENIGPSEEWRSGIVIDADVSVSDATVYFDGLGNVLSACGGLQLSSITTINIDSLAVCINPVGYIYDC